MLLSASFAQQVKSYTVKSGETIYSICKTNDVTQEQLQLVNPSLRGNLRAGQIIQIPVVQQEAKPQLTFKNHKVKRKETLYSIAKKYHVTVDDILLYNPWAKNGIRKKDILRIPDEKQLKELQAFEKAEQEKKDALSRVTQIKHQVQAGETLYGISKQYNRSVEALLAENPQAESGLKIGMVLTISEMIAKNDTSENAKVVYVVKKGDTAYRIAKNYEITVDDLYAANPEVQSHGLQTDMVLIIPTEVKKSNQVDDWTLQPAIVEPDVSAKLQHYNIALLLPFSAAKNDSVHFIPKTDAELIPAKSKSFLQMYQGVLLAVEQMRMQGMQVSLRVFDTEGSLATVKNIVAHPDFKKADLIIGPVYPQVQGPISNYAKLNHVPMVSPLSSAGDFEDSNPYYFKINPTEELIRKKTENFLANDFKSYNMLSVGIGGKGYLNQSAEFKQNFTNYMEYDAETEDVELLKRKLIYATDTLHMSNVAYIPFDKETKVSVGVSALNIAASSAPVTLVGQYNYIRFRSILTEYYHRLDLHVLSPYYIDYTSTSVIDFVQKYRENYYLEPNQFAFQGYDVAYYFMSLLFNYGENASSAALNFHPQLLQGNFQFKKTSSSAGWVNDGLFIIEYKPDFTIYRKGKVQ